MPGTKCARITDEEHQRGAVLFDQGRYEEAARLFTQALDGEESSVTWNDWATAQLLCQRGLSAEKGYRYALELDPRNEQAAANLGILLAGLGNVDEAIPLLEQGMACTDRQQRTAIAVLLKDCLEKQTARKECRTGTHEAEQSHGHAAVEQLLSPENSASANTGRRSSPGKTADQVQPVEEIQVLNREQVVAAVNKVPRWRHRIELPFGVVTPGQQDHSGMIDCLGMPSDLTGKTVLDIGCSDGLWSFEAESRGSKRVLAVDNCSAIFYYNQQGFRTAHALRRSRVEFLKADLFEFTPEQHGRFDLVLCLGVLYHVRHPLLALERLAQLCNEQLILETAIVPSADRPYMQFLEWDESNQDYTNWWAFSVDCVVAMLRSCGFSAVRPTYEGNGRAVINAFAPRLGSGIRQLLARFGDALVGEAYQHVVGPPPGSSLERNLADLPIDIFGKVKQWAAEREQWYRLQLSSTGS